MTKQRSLRKTFEWIIIYCKNVARDSAPYFPLPVPNHLQLKFNSKMQHVKRVLIASKRSIKQFHFFNLISIMSKI